MLGVVWGQVPVVEFDEIMQGQVFLPGTQIDDIRERQVVEGVQFVSLAVVDHVAHQSHFVGDFSVVLKMVETQTSFAQHVVLKAPLTLGPFESKEILFVLSLDPVFPPQQYPSHHFVIVALPQVKDTTVVSVLLDCSQLKVLN